MKANAAMKNLLDAVGAEHLDNVFPPQLLGLLAGGLNTADGCIVLGNPDSVPRLDSSRAELSDQTGYECFLNHVHLSDYCTGSSQVKMLGLGLAFCRRVYTELLDISPDREFRFIISSTDQDCVVRFHIIRPGENWVADNLDGYEEEAVLVFDSSDLRSESAIA